MTYNLYMLKRKIILLFLISLVGLFEVSAKASAKKSIKELEAQVQELNGMFNVDARKYVSVYFDLSEEYYKKKNYAKAYENAIKGLRLDSYNMEMQYRAAEYEVNNKNYNLAYPRLKYILEKSQDQKIVKDSEQLLQRIPEAEISKISGNTVIPNFNKSILIVFYPGVEDVYKKAIAQRIEQEYMLTVKTRDISYSESRNNVRDGWDDYLKDMTNRLIEDNSGEVVDNTLNALKLTREDLSSKEGREFFVHNVFLMSGYTEEDWKDIQLHCADQFDANALIAQTKENNKIEADCYGILAVTPKGIYSGSETNNFLFGLASKNIAVMSLDLFVNTTDDKAVAIKRTVMQAFSSAGHVIGIKRCSSPLCARAYPNSLEEQDQKEDKLCQTCINNINSVYSK